MDSKRGGPCSPPLRNLVERTSNYSMISATTPAPTVRPPSRIAKRSSLSIAIGVVESPRHRVVAARSHLLLPLRSLLRPPHVRRPEVERRPLPVEERRVPPALLLRQDVHLRLEVRVRRDRP